MCPILDKNSVQEMFTEELSRNCEYRETPRSKPLFSKGCKYMSIRTFHSYCPTWI